MAELQACDQLRHFGEHLRLEGKHGQVRQFQHGLTVIILFEGQQLERLRLNAHECHRCQLFKVAFLHIWRHVYLIVVSDLLLLQIEILVIVFLQFMEHLALFVDADQIVLLSKEDYVVFRLRSVVYHWCLLLTLEFVQERIAFFLLRHWLFCLFSGHQGHNVRLVCTDSDNLDLFLFAFLHEDAAPD